MRQRIEHFTFFVVLALTTVSLYGNELLPKPARLVFDTAGVLAPQESARLEAKLERLRDSGATGAVIYIAPALPQQTAMEELTRRSVNEWGLGNKGIALFAFIRDRKLRIEVGRGLHAQISDAAAAAMIEERIVPAFREGNYAEGLSAAIDQLELLIREGPRADVRPVAKTITTRLGPTQRIVGPANAPRVTRRVHPHYPDEARRAGKQGQVHLEVLITSAGQVADVTVTRGLPDGLTQAAATAVRQWVFEPVVDADGKPIPALVDAVVMFRTSSNSSSF